jgi:hypothetical protein
MWYAVTCCKAVLCSASPSLMTCHCNHSNAAELIMSLHLNETDLQKRRACVSFNIMMRTTLCLLGEQHHARLTVCVLLRRYCTRGCKQVLSQKRGPGRQDSQTLGAPGSCYERVAYSITGMAAASVKTCQERCTSQRLNSSWQGTAGGHYRRAHPHGR